MEENKLDIGYGEPWPGNVLSNIYPHSFVFNDISYSSMEAFLQCLKFSNEDDVERIRMLAPFNARREGQKGNGWKKHQILYLYGEPFDRQSDVYDELIRLAYEACYDQNLLYRLGLHVAKNLTLDHSIGYNDPTQTILTVDDFVKNLTHLINRNNVMSNWKEQFDEMFKTSVVLDTETTGIDTSEAEIIELAFLHSDIEKPELMRFKSIKPIPPEASAVHHITDKMVRNEPTFGQSLERITDRLTSRSTQYYIAHNSQFDQQILIASAKRDDDPFMADEFTNAKWICTWRLAKAVLGIDYTKFQYNLSYLRYALRLDIPDDVPAHRGDADVLVCYKLFEKLVEIAFENKLIYEDKTLGEQLYDLCWSPNKVATWPMGKYKGQKLEDIPTSFYTWAIENIDLLKEEHERYDLDLATSVARVLEARLS